MTKAVRGAIQVLENSRAVIETAAARLVREILRVNGIAQGHIVSIIFSVTLDLTAGNPATGARGAGLAETPLFCAQEPVVEGAMPRVIRVLLTWDALERRPVVPVYLDGAEALRPDLAKGGHA
jgi:chorismate mutase